MTQQWVPRGEVKRVEVASGVLGCWYPPDERQAKRTKNKRWFRLAFVCPSSGDRL